MTYSNKDAINLHVKFDFKQGEPQPRITPEMKKAFTESAAYWLIKHGGNNVIRKYETHYDGDCGEWGLLVARAKQDLQGHFDADIIHRARFEIR